MLRTVSSPQELPSPGVVRRNNGDVDDRVRVGRKQDVPPVWIFLSPYPRGKVVDLPAGLPMTNGPRTQGVKPALKFSVQPEVWATRREQSRKQEDSREAECRAEFPEDHLNSLLVRKGL